MKALTGPIGALVLFFSLASCQASQTTKKTTETSSSISTPQVSPSLVATPTPTPTSLVVITTPIPQTLSPSKPVLPCTTNDLSVTESAAPSYAGHSVLQFIAQNTKGQSCTVDGFFTVSLLDSNNNPLSIAEQLGGGQAALGNPALIKLSPKASAYFLLEADDFNNDGSPCPSASSGLFTPPGASGSVRVPFKFSIAPCNATFKIGAVTRSA